MKLGLLGQRSKEVQLSTQKSQQIYYKLKAYITLGPSSSTIGKIITMSLDVS